MEEREVKRIERGKIEIKTGGEGRMRQRKRGNIDKEEKERVGWGRGR